MDKQTALTAVQEGFDAVLASIDGASDEALNRQVLGSWNAKDILAHLAGWQVQMTGAMERMARGEKPTPEGVDYSDGDAWNARFAAAMKAQNATTVIAEFKQSFANYLRAAQAIPDERFGEGKTINRLLETSTIGHYKEHLPELKQLKAN